MSGQSLDCVKCPSLCCRMAGYVEVSRADIRRLARFLGITVRAFEERHIVERTRKGARRIKSGYTVCQFLTDDRMCGVYEARPRDCRGYVCWDQHDDTVYQFARFFQKPPTELRDEEAAERGGSPPGATRAPRARSRPEPIARSKGMTKDTPHADRFGGPGSSHQDRTQPDATDQPTGHKGGGNRAGTPPAPGEPTNPERSRVSGGGGERDRHHTHDPKERS